MPPERESPPSLSRPRPLLPPFPLLSPFAPRKFRFFADRKATLPRVTRFPGDSVACRSLEHPFQQRGPARLGFRFLPSICGTTLGIVIQCGTTLRVVICGAERRTTLPAGGAVHFDPGHLIIRRAIPCVPVLSLHAVQPRQVDGAPCLKSSTADFRERHARRGSFVPPRIDASTSAVPLNRAFAIAPSPWDIYTEVRI